MSSSDETPSSEEMILSFIEQHFYLTGELLSAEKAYQEFGIPVGMFNKVLKDPGTREALEEKGMVFSRYEEDNWTGKALTPKQLAVANSLLDLTDTRSEKKKLQDLEVHTLTYNAWLRDPVFKKYLAERAKQMIGDNEHQVDLALIDRIKAGDLKAIAYYNEMTGRFVPQRANASQVDIQNVLVKVIEIIAEEVTDKDDALRISNRLKSMIGARNIAGALVGAEEDPIVIPEVVKVREIES